MGREEGGDVEEVAAELLGGKTNGEDVESFTVGETNGAGNKFPGYIFGAKKDGEIAVFGIYAYRVVGGAEKEDGILLGRTCTAFEAYALHGVGADIKKLAEMKRLSHKRDLGKGICRRAA